MYRIILGGKFMGYDIELFFVDGTSVKSEGHDVSTTSIENDFIRDFQEVKKNNSPIELTDGNTGQTYKFDGKDLVAVKVYL